MKKYAVVFGFLILLSVPSLAWGPEGHRIVGDIAQERLTSTARLQVKELLGNDDLPAIAVWADESGANAQRLTAGTLSIFQMMPEVFPNLAIVIARMKSMRTRS